MKKPDLAKLRAGYHDPDVNDYLRDWFRLQLQKAAVYYNNKKEDEE